MFERGQKIVYPMHGAGYIEQIEGGEDTGYYVIRIPNGNVMIRIPMERAEDAGLRGLMGREDVEKLVTQAGESRQSNSENWNIRYKENLERLRTGKLEAAAEVVKLLTERERRKKLSLVEGRLLGMARQIVLSEIISVYEINGEKAEELLAKWIKIG